MIESISEDFLDVGLVENGKEYFFSLVEDRLRLYSIKTGALYIEYELQETLFPDYFETSEDGKYLIVRDNSTFWKISFEDGSTEWFQVKSDKMFERFRTCVSSDFSLWAVTDQEENAIMLYQVGEEDPFAKINVVASYVKDMFFTKDGEYLLVSVYDDSAQIIEVASGTCMQKYDVLSGTLKDIVTLQDGKGYLIKTVSGSYWLNQNFEKIAWIVGGTAMKPKAEEFHCTNQRKV